MDLELVRLLDRVELPALGGRIRDMRRARSMTQGQLSAGDVTVGYISRIEAGQRRPDLRLLKSFAERLGTSLGYLLTGVTEERQDSERLTAAEIGWALEKGDGATAHRLAADLITTATDSAGVQRARLLYAQALEAQGHLQDAISQLEQMLTRDDTAVNPAASIALSRCYRESGELDRAITVGESGLAALRRLELDGSEEAIQLTVTVAAAYFERGDTNYAVRLCRTACDKAESAGSVLARASAYWNASVMESRRGATDTAVQLAESALSLLRVQSDARNLARLQGQLGIMLLQLDPPRIDEAKQTLGTASRQLTEHGAGAVDVARCRVALARAHLLEGDRDTARTLADEVNERFRDVSPAAQAEALVILGELASDHGDKALARQRYAEAVAALTSVGADRGAAQLWFDLAARLEHLGDTQGALEAYRSASVSAGLAPSMVSAASSH